MKKFFLKLAYEPRVPLAAAAATLELELINTLAPEEDSMLITN